MDEREKRVYTEKIIAGEDANTFLGKDLAKYLIKKSDEDVDAAFQRFLTLDPHDFKAVTECQVAARSAMGAIEWLKDAVTDGARALDEYTQRRELEKTEGEGVL